MVMPVLLVFCLAVFVVVARTADLSDCDYSRELAVQCARLVTDTNHNGFVTIDEMENAKSRALHWYEMPFAALVGPSSEEVIAQ